MVEIGDQYWTSFTAFECSRIGVGDAEVLAQAVEARTGMRNAELGLRSRMLLRGSEFKRLWK